MKRLLLAALLLLLVVPLAVAYPPAILTSGPTVHETGEPVG